jgi:hypothetical protein
MGRDGYGNDPALVRHIPLSEMGLNKPFVFCFIHNLSTSYLLQRTDNKRNIN